MWRLKALGKGLLNIGRQIFVETVDEFSKILKIINIIASIWFQKYLVMFVRARNLFLKDHSSRCIFSSQMEITFQVS